MSFLLRSISIFIIFSTICISQQPFIESANGPFRGLIKTLIECSNGNILAGVDGYNIEGHGGIWISTDDGDSWQEMNNTLSNKSIVSFCYDSSGNLYAGTRQGIYKSVNNGNSWNYLNLNEDSVVVNEIAVNSVGDIFIASWNGVFRSQDNGTTWEKKNVGISDTTIIGIGINSMDEIFAVSYLNGYVYHSTDNGDNWSLIFQLNDWIFTLLITSTDDIFLGTIRDGILRSTNNGISWDSIFFSTYYEIYKIKENAFGHLLACIEDGIYKSFDNGDNWVNTSFGLTDKWIRSLLEISVNNWIAGTHFGAIFKSIDNSQTWRQVNTVLTNKYVSSIQITSSDQIYIGSYGVFQSIDRAENWQAINSGLLNLGADIMAIDDSGFVYIHSRDSSFYRKHIDSTQWKPVFQNLPKLDRYTVMIIDANNYFFVSDLREGIYRSVDNGNNWIQINQGLTTNSIITLESNSLGHLFAGSLLGVFRSLNNGDSWEFINNGMNLHQVWDIAINSSNHIFIVSVNPTGIFKSTDNGNNWQQISSNIEAIRLGVNSADHIYAGTFQGQIFRSINGDSSWQEMAVSDPPNLIRALSFNSSDYLFIGTEGSGFYRSVQSTLTDIDIRKPIKLKTFQLSQNYPNPFNPQTNLKFYLNQPSQVTLIVFNTRGQKVKTLLNTYRLRGEYNIIWDGTDERNENVSSGVYYFQLNTTGGKETRKMVLIR